MSSPEIFLSDVAARLQAAVGSGKLGVAYSGGVDSATLLSCAVHALGADRVVGILAVSPSLAARERAMAHDTAQAIGARIIEIFPNEAANEAYRRNDVDRCYFCKSAMFSLIDASVVAAEGLAAVAYGENADDAQRIDRPGARAATEFAVLRPLADVGLAKANVREVARHLGVPVADKPAAPCLASRIPHGQEVTREKLAAVEAVELALYELGFSDSRVRHHGDIARIELPRDEMARALDADVADAIDGAAHRAGFEYATVDVRGIQSGRMTLKLLEVRA